ncbi:hypothetical protein [Actinoplanes sp. NPDC049265]|uniref:hypothetical protein n=1 Tax=Actinoplanes sp. NPDC049265 TaxID=3363902 RepID=UPI00371D3904
MSVLRVRGVGLPEGETIDLYAGVTLIRSPGRAGDPPQWFGRDPELPRAVHAGPWIARPGAFFDGWWAGHPPTPWFPPGIRVPTWTSWTAHSP